MASFHEFIPKSVLCLKSYTFDLFKKDLLAGLTVGIIALPLAMAFAIGSGVSPERGIYTAIVAGFLISLFGGSRLQIGGPTGAFVVIIYDIIQRTGYEGLAISTLIAGVLLILFGLSRVGSWIKYVPYPLITGFTTGIAILIFSSQIKDFFGLKMGAVPADFTLKWASYFQTLPTVDLSTLAVGGGTLGFIIFLRRFFPKIPWGIGAIAFATLITFFFQIPIETVHSTFGQIPSALPWPTLPLFSISLGQFPELFKDAITIALLGGIESLLSSVIADQMAGTRHKSNCELVAQGIGNIGSILFGGIPATGAIARTAANVKTGAQTPVAGMIHAATLFFILLFFAPVVSQIPLAALAAVLMMIAWNMSEAVHFIRLLKAPAGDRAILLIAFFLTIFVDITAAIITGMILASFLFMKRMGDFSTIVRESDPIQNRTIPSHMAIYEMQGPLFFGAADTLHNVMADPALKVFILRMRQVPMIDASGIRALKELQRKCKKNQTTLILSDVCGSLKRDLENHGSSQFIESELIFPDIDKALEIF